MTTHAFSFSRVARFAAAPLMLGALAACGSPAYRADVSRFQSQLPAPQGQTFAVVADDPALAGGLEFSQYADLVEAEMAKLGYTEGTPEDATLLVRFDYGIDKGRERIRRTGFRDPFYDPWYRFSYRPVYYRTRHGYRVGYFPGRRWGYGFYDPWFGGRDDITSQTIYTSDIDMKIDNTVTGERVFEGKAEAVSTSKRLQYHVPNLVEAMFTDFPGNSGETLRISIRPEETRVRRID